VSDSTLKSVSNMPVFAGMCVIEDESLLLEIAQELKLQFKGLPVDFYFKASFDKANRTAIDGFRGPGLDAGLQILQRVKEKINVPIITDYHSSCQAEKVAQIADVIQVPAFLCRQTDVVCSGARAALKYNRGFNIKKGQFLAPWDVNNIIEKVRSVEKNEGKTLSNIWITERGSSFGYNRLIVDMASFQCIQSFGVPVIFDATHSVQLPGAAVGGKATGGARENIEVLSRAAIAAGADGVFLECHTNPKVAKSDSTNAFYLEHVGTFIRQLLEIRSVLGKLPKLLSESKKL